MNVRLDDIFHVNYGTKFDMNKMTISEKSSIAFVSRSSKNNGIVANVDLVEGVEPLKAGAITVTLGGTYVLSSFLQETPFYTGQNVAVLTPKKELTREQKLYYCMCISKNRYRYSAFGREANRTLKSLRVPNFSAIPDWVNDTDISQFYGADKAKDENVKIEIKPVTWKDFTYDEIFTIERGKGPRKKDLDGTGTTPFVTSSDNNNGLTNVTKLKPVHRGNTIGVNRNGSVAEAFYQPVPFCSTEDVHIFTPKFSDFDKYVGLFICALIKKEKYRYNYGRKWGIARMKSSIIKLPTNAQGEIDCNYMRNYIKSLPYSSSV